MMTTEERLRRQRERMRRRNETAEGRAVRAQWASSERGRELRRQACARYRRSEKGLAQARKTNAAARVRYHQMTLTSAGREFLRDARRPADVRYRRSEKGRQSLVRKRPGQARYRSTERGRQCSRRGQVARWEREVCARLGTDRPEILDAARALLAWKRYRATGDPARRIPSGRKKVA